MGEPVRSISLYLHEDGAWTVAVDQVWLSGVWPDAGEALVEALFVLGEREEADG